ncbi:hypothetical protein [Pseudoalteromonas luteoviolacea]|uniref:Adhesin domain-containing protein n=1 Tax=Pseudoalteromonas luteoviolacea (strain 2ta16) TaxID=1353533 RepID=V4H279_PSEL2|nr:hypothetical protein [Pseudoalteromonas luteoviolacea]ESP91556.1 hypothetical protein PL2TA16_00355 [Pseudoalteromonas luteoviolacea 2ta16]KZN40203.1 hypothetical protein N483_18610 [Pseudoalteromonas luteoviolacea NCIMB 1944]
MKIYFLTAVAFFCTQLSAMQLFSNDFDFVESRTLSLPVADLDRLKIDAGSGKLTVIGEETDKISVKADIYQSQASTDYCFELIKQKNIALLTANTCHRAYNHTLLHLTITVPSELLTEIKDRSGAIIIENASVSRIEDGSGSIRISNNLLSVEIEDGSGNINIHGVHGAIAIGDGSGKVVVEQVDGDVSIEDGSGKIVVKNVSGKVVIDDGSGSVLVRNAHSFELIDNSSGKIQLIDIKEQL